MAVLLPSLETSGTREGTLIAWLPEDIFWFEFVDGVPEGLLSIEKFRSGKELEGILQESYNTSELFIDMFDNFISKQDPKWWADLGEKERLGVLAGLRGYLGPEYELPARPELIGGFSTLDMCEVLKSPAWKNEYWSKLVSWNAIISPKGEGQ